MRCAGCCVLLGVLLCTAPVWALDNPFYSQPAWKQWRLDTQRAVAGGKTVQPIAPNKRWQPQAKGKRAGIWDDVYASLDNHHSRLPANISWPQAGKLKLSSQLMMLVFPQVVDSRILHALGVHYSSQSTTGMGHDLVANPQRVLGIEREYCFANVLRAGPAHTSYREGPEGPQNRYTGLFSCLFNSVGSSGSEVQALAKMMAASAWLRPELKAELVHNGLLIPTMLALWRNALPYAVGPDNELRHRVAYASSGNAAGNLAWRQVETNDWYHLYDEDAHRRRMQTLAMQLQQAPPVAQIRLLQQQGGHKLLSSRTMLQIDQRRGETVRLKLSASDSFAAHDGPLHLRWVNLYPETGIRIEPADDGREATIEVPFDARLPTGLSVVLLLAEDRYGSIGLPATININRTHGADNQRPVLDMPVAFPVLAGQTLDLPIPAHDPEGFPLHWYHWSGDPGQLLPGHWQVTSGAPGTTQTLHLLLSDGTGAVSGQRIQMRAQDLVLKPSCTVQGQRVQCQAGLQQRLPGTVSLHWQMDDGSRVTGADITHRYQAPGIYRIRVHATQGAYQTEAESWVQVAQHWPLGLDQGWDAHGLNPRYWQEESADAKPRFNGRSKRPAVLFFKGGNPLANSIRSRAEWAPPFYLSFTVLMQQSRPGTGLIWGDFLLGKAELKQARSHAVTGVRSKRGEWALSPFMPTFRQAAGPMQVTGFFSLDPKRSGQCRFRGLFRTPQRQQYVAIGNLSCAAARLHVRNAAHSGHMMVHALQLHLPPR